LVDATADDPQARLIVLLGGHAGLRCGEMMALEWSDVDLNAGSMTVARSDWKATLRCRKAGARGASRSRRR